MQNKSRRRKQSSPRKPLGPITRYQIEGITHDARGIARNNGKVTFIAGALPGETVQAQVSKSNRRYDEAILKSIEVPAEDRVLPDCQHYAQCGGCSFQHLAYEKQLQAKSNWLKGQLRSCYEGNIDTLTNTPYGYRRRARLSVKVAKNGEVKSGFRAKGSADIVKITSCLVLTSSLQALLPVLQDILESVDNPERIGHIELLEDELGCSVLLRLISPLSKVDKARWQTQLKNHHATLYLQQPNGEIETEAMSIARQYTLNNIVMTYQPQAFIQVNQTINERMITQALDWLELKDTDRVLDLFCGIGNFSLPIAAYVNKVVGVEVQENMVASAKQNAELNGLHNATFIGADLTQSIQHEALDIGFNKVLLDPPRAGAIEFLPSLIKLSPETILYVSCDAATLARDAGILVAEGYQVTRVSMMEMFPQTSHIETMMLLQK
ncbi:23S rRNA (uracil(1939)-C(5))-methyltransferase RlmD [Marinomonas agarivorans]|nr:23S rRNA (uracil(1939)-C(5))-methyltransferase RlmD [Marinomonas agarivorans]